ncbi:hypothetical protein BaRGS_00034146 [Batillaria attramentaria]|uniref:G-protein coupled receptors family 1 profile domain-containing protein n=1 Tax=Batillaria attramentaria TaxID=370345 RepID=A0ABD0JJI5_9CAEN
MRQDSLQGAHLVDLLLTTDQPQTTDAGGDVWKPYAPNMTSTEADMLGMASNKSGQWLNELSEGYLTNQTFTTGFGLNETGLGAAAGDVLSSENSFWRNETGLDFLDPDASLLNDSVYWCQNESALPHDEHYIEFYETAQFITGLILYPCICLPGLVANCLTLIVFSDKNLRTSTNAFLSALAVADSLKLINDLLYFCTILLLRTDDEMGNKAYGYLYPYAHFIFNMSACVSSWLTVSVAVERYIMVCHPTRARNVCNRNRAICVSAAVFLVMTALALPSAFR